MRGNVLLESVPYVDIIDPSLLSIDPVFITFLQPTS